MSSPQYGVTSQGFKLKRLPEIKDELENLFIGEFGDVNLDPQSVVGQIIGIFSKVLADDWENLQDVYLSQYPNSADGISLDNLVQLMGLERLQASKTRVIGTAIGNPGTFIPVGSLARLNGSIEIFSSVQNAIIDNSRALINHIQVTQSLPQRYLVVINGTSYYYGLPSIDFSAPLVAGNQVRVRINGISMPLVNFNTSSNQTLIDIGNVIITNVPYLVNNFVVNGDSLELYPVLGESLNVTTSVTGAGAPTVTTSYLIPPDEETIAENLSAIINKSSVVSSSWNGDDIFEIKARSVDFPYSIVVGNGLDITLVGSPIIFDAQNYGLVVAPAGSLTIIMSPVSGWNSLTNFEQGSIGRLQETDEELRLRFKRSLSSQGAATVEAIRSRILQEVPSVTSVIVFENVTLTQSPMTISFNEDFVSGNTTQVNVENHILGTVNFTSNHLQMMNDIRTLLLTSNEINLVNIIGANNREFYLEFESGEEVEVILTTIGGASQPISTVSGGRPPKSFEAIVEGGTDIDVAKKIWELKPAGIQSFGNVTLTILDSQGQAQSISFTRASPVYIWADVILTLNPQESFPSNGLTLVAQAILEYGNSLGIGTDIFIQKVQSVAFFVPGIAKADVQLATTNNLSDVPIYVTTDISIGQTEVSYWDISRISVGI